MCNLTVSELTIISKASSVSKYLPEAILSTFNVVENQRFSVGFANSSYNCPNFEIRVNFLINIGNISIFTKDLHKAAEVKLRVALIRI